MRFTSVIALVAVAWLTAVTRAQDVTIRVTGDQLQIAAPSLQFISGKPLDTLRNGAAVAFDVRVSLLGDSRQTIIRQTIERFVISYDLWEERFSVTRMMRSNRASASHLTARQAEAWCLDRLELPIGGLPTDRQFQVRLDIRANHGRDTQPLEEDGLSIGALIELFSRPGKSPGVTQWRAESAPFTLAALRRTQSR